MQKKNNNKIKIEKEKEKERERGRKRETKKFHNKTFYNNVLTKVLIFLDFDLARIRQLYSSGTGRGTDGDTG